MTGTSDAGGCLGVIVHLLRREGSRAFLFVQRSGGRYEGQWWPVAGTCEPGEHPVETAVREVEEELGLVPVSLYATGYNAPHIEGKGHLEIFAAYARRGDRIRLNYEHDAYRWLSLEEALDIVPPDAAPLLRMLQERYVAAPPPEAVRVWPR